MINIQPVETEGAFWVRLSMDGCAMEPRGPFATPDEAEAVAHRIAGICRGAFRQPVSIGGRELAPAVAASAKRRA
jgi:hypothetical protein